MPSSRHDIAIAAHEAAIAAHEDAIRRRSEIARSDAMLQSTTAREETAAHIPNNGEARHAAEAAETEAVRAREPGPRNACHRRAIEEHRAAIHAIAADE